EPEADVARERQGARLVGDDDDERARGVGHRSGDAADGAAGEAAFAAEKPHARRAGTDVRRQNLQRTGGGKERLGHENRGSRMTCLASSSRSSSRSPPARARRASPSAIAPPSSM